MDWINKYGLMLLLRCMESVRVREEGLVDASWDPDLSSFVATLGYYVRLTAFGVSTYIT